jgi:glycosyltransferase involved in cell wall biosynthesis
VGHDSSRRAKHLRRFWARRKHMNKLRVLAIGHSYTLSVNRAIAREVARDSRFDITIGAPEFFQGDLRPIHCEPEPEGSLLKLVKIKAHWTSRIHIFRYGSAELRHLIQQQHFDAIHAWEEPYIYAGYQIAKLAIRNKIRFCFFTFQNLNKRYPQPFGHFEKVSVQGSQRWLAGGKSVFNNMVERNYPRDRGRIITPAVDTAAFCPAGENAQAAVRAELNLQGPIIGFVGRLVPAKGLRVLMEALEGLDQKSHWSLLLLGSGEMKEEIEQWAERRQWQRRIKILLAAHDDVPRYLSAMDLMVAPSQTMSNWKEQFGRMLIEAFACAVPVIASDSGEIPVVVGDAGFIVPEKNVAEWTRTIQQLLDDPILRKQTGLAGLARVPQFSVKHVAAQFRDFYEELSRA